MVVPKFRAFYEGKMYEVKAVIWTSRGLYVTLDEGNKAGRRVRGAKLMRSTGLFDKNGKEIFEGDIVRMHSGELLPVKLHHGMFEPVCYYASRAFGRVGNVFENPELLEHPDFREEIND
ncbi:YopX family protein [Streptococcus porci]|uniref:YopX family protein n=1 Tax=Streptococcus porci TaxID=502567 RepID=UPI000684CF6D|nr:YopX family protein [Streptococcus porci]